MTLNTFSCAHLPFIQLLQQNMVGGGAFKYLLLYHHCSNAFFSIAASPMISVALIIHHPWKHDGLFKCHTLDNAVPSASSPFRPQLGCHCLGWLSLWPALSVPPGSWAYTCVAALATLWAVLPHRGQGLCPPLLCSHSAHHMTWQESRSNIVGPIYYASDPPNSPVDKHWMCQP